MSVMYKVQDSINY